MMKQALSLYELNQLVSETIQTAMPDDYWVEAELSELREVRGHCYMELVQKDERTNTPVAKASAKCWKNKWMLMRPYFERTTGQVLRAGMKVLLKVYANFHEAYGFSWIVTDIDPVYTMGDMARKRLEIIARLKAEGVFDLQKDLHLSMFARRVAVISSEQAAGYGDFLRQLKDCGQGFNFEVQLFPAVMQGERVESSVIEALNHINAQVDDFDVVVIIRGGGATSDLSGFDTLSLAENVANFPLPIITGIGHERDESVLDMVSFRRVKTPTAAAAYLIDNLADTLARIDDAQSEMVLIVRHCIEQQKSRFVCVSSKIPVLFSHVRARQEERLQQYFLQLTARASRIISDAQHHVQVLSNSLKPMAESQIVTEGHRLDMLRQRCRSLDPQLLLSRGYSITLHQGRAVRHAGELKAGDEIETRVENGTFKSIIK